MNRLLQHFVDTNGTTSSRPPIPAPPQSSGGSYHGRNRGSYQRETPGGPFYYQPSHAQSPWQQPPQPVVANGLEEIPLTSHSSGDRYETVDLNADKSPPQPLFNSPPNKKHPLRASTGSAAELFAHNSSPTASDFFNSVSSSSNGDNPFQSPSTSVNSSSFVANGSDKVNEINTPNTFNTVFHASGDKDGGNYLSQKDQVTTNFQNSDSNLSTLHSPYIATQNEEMASVSFVEKSVYSEAHTSQNEAQGLQLSSADVLFGAAAPLNNGDWTHSVPSSSALPPPPGPNPVQAQEDSLVDTTPSASSLFSAEAPKTFQIHETTPFSPPKNGVSLPPKPPSGVPPPSPAKSHPSVQFPASNSCVETPMKNASMTRTKSPVAVSVPPVRRPEDHVSPAIESMKLSPPAKSSLKAGLEARHLKFPAVKREDDVLSNAPSLAPSRMSMLSTLDDSLKLSDMYKQMSARLEGEKHELLKVVANQAQEIAQMKKHIKSLELQLKTYQTQTR